MNEREIISRSDRLRATMKVRARSSSKAEQGILPVIQVAHTHFTFLLGWSP
jgi:hypothetical protein